MVATKNHEFHNIKIKEEVYLQMIERVEKATGVRPAIGAFVEKAIEDKVKQLEVASHKRGK
jgi:hypothetical protein